MSLRKLSLEEICLEDAPSSNLVKGESRVLSFMPKLLNSVPEGGKYPQSSYDVGIVTELVDSFHQYLKALGSYFEVYYDQVSGILQVDNCFSLTTIYPPKNEPGHLLFGYDKPRCFTDLAFTTKQVTKKENVSNTDFLDLLFCFKSRDCANASSETLASLYDKRAASLCANDCILNGNKIVRSSLLFASYQKGLSSQFMRFFNPAVRRIVDTSCGKDGISVERYSLNPVLHDTIFLPSSCSDFFDEKSGKFSDTKQVPVYVASEHYFKRDILLPEKLMAAATERLNLASAPIKGPVDSRGITTFTITRAGPDQKGGDGVLKISLNLRVKDYFDYSVVPFRYKRKSLLFPIPYDSIDMSFVRPETHSFIIDNDGACDPASLSDLGFIDPKLDVIANCLRWFEVTLLTRAVLKLKDSLGNPLINGGNLDVLEQVLKDNFSDFKDRLKERYNPDYFLSFTKWAALKVQDFIDCDPGDFDSIGKLVCEQELSMVNKFNLFPIRFVSQADKGLVNKLFESNFFKMSRPRIARGCLVPGLQPYFNKAPDYDVFCQIITELFEDSIWNVEVTDEKAQD